MCISIFAKQKSINIEYASECVWLDKDGLMEIAIDLLITNKSSEPIDKLHCIVPQKLIPKEGANIPWKYKNDNYFEDITEDLLEDNSKYNYPPQEKMYNLSTDKNDVSNNNLELKLANPNKVSEIIYYQGFYSGGNEMIPFLDIDEVGQAILSKSKFTALTIKLGTELEVDKPRWFRWKFLTLTGPLQLFNRTEYQFNRITNNLTYNFSINGPGKITSLLITYLESFKPTMKEFARINNQSVGTVADTHSSLVKTLINENINHLQTKVSINDWRTRFYHQSLEQFTSIQIEGDVKTAGSQPNFIDGLKDVYYEWKTGAIHFESKNDDGNFTVRVQSGYTPAFYRYLPLISLFIALIGLALSVYNLELF